MFLQLTADTQREKSRMTAIVLDPSASSAPTSTRCPSRVVNVELRKMFDTRSASG